MGWTELWALRVFMDFPGMPEALWGRKGDPDLFLGLQCWPELSYSLASEKPGARAAQVLGDGRGTAGSGQTTTSGCPTGLDTERMLETGTLYI